jgi:hypothetical protein
MNNNNLTYTLIINGNNVINEVQLYFNNGADTSRKISGGNFFYTKKETIDTTDLSIFDFCENISRDINYLKDIAYRRFIELEDFLNSEENTTHINKIEKERINKIILFQEEKIEKASVLINLYFKMFKTDKITKTNWEDFSKYFDLNLIAPNIKNIVTINGKTSEHDGFENYSRFINNEEQNKQISGFKRNIEKNNFKARKKYLCHNSKEIISIIIDNIFVVKPNCIIKKCTNCHKLYIPERGNSNGCSRISPKDKNKTCMQEIKYQNNLKSLKKEPAKKLRKIIYDRHYRRINNSKNEHIEDEIFLKNFKEKGAFYRKQVDKGIISKDEYIKWLEKVEKTDVIPSD